MIEVITHPAPDAWPALMRRATATSDVIAERVRPVLVAVKTEGDAAVRRFTAQFDGYQGPQLRVSPAQLAAAEAELDAELVAAIRLAKANIETFHEAQHEVVREIETMPGVRCWRKSVPIERVGLYIPGGTAPLLSTVLMLGVPARLAGCRQIVLCSPGGKAGRIHPAVLYAAHLLGLEDVFMIGGAQAVAAMAYGTESVPAVDKIFGPGNQYVTTAKQLVSQQGIAIDMEAGPSEVLIIADAAVPPAFIAADLLAQAEHGVDSQVILVTPDADLAQAVNQALAEQLSTLPRRAIAEAALQHSRTVVVKDLAAAVAFSNAYAPEHLIIATQHARQLGEQITNAGSVFLGYYTPESVGDYASGTNHTLPTNGQVRAFSGVSLDSFIKKISFQELSPDGLRRLGPAVERMATAEALDAHRLAVSVRLRALDNGTSA